MPNVRIDIDGKTEFDGKLDQWTQTPPDFIRDNFQPSMKPEPHMQAVLVAMTDAIMRDEDVYISIETASDGWGMGVAYE